MDEAVEDRIGDGGVGDAGMPFAHRDLGGDHGGDAALTIIEDLEQVVGMGCGSAVAHPVIRDEKLEFGQLASKAG